MSKANSKSKATESQCTQANSRLASNPGTASEVLDKLANSSKPDIAERVAENPNTGADTLEKLSNHESSEVRGAVTENTNTSDETLEQHSTDKNPDVRFRLAENANTPVELLESLALDDNPFVLSRAEDTLERLKSIAQRADEMLIQERFAEAEELYEKLILGLEGLLGAGHQEVSAALHKLAAALVGQGKLNEAASIESRVDIISAA